MNESQSNSFLAEQPVGALMRKFSLPCILSLLVGALYNIVDQLFIANASYLGSYGNAANSVVFPLTVIALAIATMIGDGCCAYVSIRLGAGEPEQAHRSVGNAIVLTLIVSVVLTAVYLIFMDPILTAFGATVNAETFALSREYCFWIALGIPFYMFGQAMNPIIRSDGSPRYAMLSLLAGAVCNIILDPIFIFPCGWGMMGAAVATVIGQILSAVLAAAYLLHMKAVRLQRSSFRLRGELLRAFLPLGMTSFLSQVSIVFSMAAVLNMCRKYGALDPVFGQAQYAQIPTAVVGIVMKFFQIVISIAIGLSAGCIPVVGYNIGAGRRDRARALLHRLLLAEAVVGLVATALFESCPGVFADLFGAKNESAYYTDFAVRCIRWFLGAAALSCVNKGAMIYLQALGKAWTSTALSLLREIVLGVGLVLLLPVWFGLDGVLYFMAAADAVTFIVTVPVLVRTTGRCAAKTTNAHKSPPAGSACGRVLSIRVYLRKRAMTRSKKSPMAVMTSLTLPVKDAILSFAPASCLSVSCTACTFESRAFVSSFSSERQRFTSWVIWSSVSVTSYSAAISLILARSSASVMSFVSLRMSLSSLTISTES